MNALLITFQALLFFIALFVVYVALTWLLRKHWPDHLLHIEKTFFSIYRSAFIVVAVVYLIAKMTTVISYGPKVALGQTKMPPDPQMVEVTPGGKFVESEDRRGNFDVIISNKDD